MVFFKVALWKGVIQFQKIGKLNPRYIGPFRMLESIEPIAYCLELPPEFDQIHNIFHVSMLRKYVSDPSHVLGAPPVELNKDLSFEVQPVDIIDQGMKELRNKIILMVKILWRSDTIEETT